MKHLSIILILLLFATSTLFAKVTLPEIMSDNMVLQQNAKVKIWGKSKANANITVTSSWSNVKTQTKSDKNGNWIAVLETPAGGFTKHTLTISDGEPVTLNNILIGEVWLASGQSNMEMPLNGFWNNPVKDANKTIALSGNNKGIRFVTIPKPQQ